MEFTHPKDYVDSLRRLYQAGKITEEYIRGLKDKGKLTEAEMLYILA